MTRRLLIMLLVLNSGPAYAEWVPVSGIDQARATVYVDPGTIHPQGNLVTLWYLTDFKTMQGGQSPSRFSSTKTHKQFDCAKERLLVLAATDFYGKMGTGELSAAYVDKDNWLSAEPGSLNQALWKVACGKK
ncbi:MAG: surface-adhesin E family protein [Nitrospirota bacterium]